MSLKSKIQALITAANAKTGETDATLTDAVQTLVDGYGQGGTPVINPLSVTANGTYTAPSGVDGYNPVTVNVSGGGVTPVGTYITHHEVVTIQSAFTGNIVDFEDALMELAGLQGKIFAYFAQKPKENYIYNDWYCGFDKGIGGIFNISGSQNRGFRYRDGFISTEININYDAAAEAGSQYDVYAVEYVSPMN